MLPRKATLNYTNLEIFVKHNSFRHLSSELRYSTLHFSKCLCRKPKKKQKGSKEMLIGDQAMKANQDLLNMAMEADTFLLQQQVAIEEQMYMLGMQPEQEYMPYFDDETHKMPKKG